MSGEHRRLLVLPAIVVAVGAWFLFTHMEAGTLKPPMLRPVNWAGLAVMAAGLVAAVAARRRPLVRLAGVVACGVGAILIICL
ncbi:MAG: hypothetical protein IJ646_13420 [Clostridia bacterium]|nr:hypothetical protein [Clostridia bacterium]